MAPDDELAKHIVDNFTNKEIFAQILIVLTRIEERLKE